MNNEEDVSMDDLKALLSVNTEADFLNLSRSKAKIYINNFNSYLLDCQDKQVKRLLEKCVKQLNKEIEYYDSRIDELNLGHVKIAC